jgi:hypothetical protein
MMGSREIDRTLEPGTAQKNPLTRDHVRIFQYISVIENEWLRSVKYLDVEPFQIFTDLGMRIIYIQFAIGIENVETVSASVVVPGHAMNHVT